MSGIVQRLRTESVVFDMRGRDIANESADEIESLRQQLAECERERDYWKGVAESECDAKNELHQVCRDAYEVWAGSEGIPEPVYASEAYLYQLLINMRDEVKRGLAKLGADKAGEK